MHRTDAARNVANQFVDKNIGAGTRGTVVDAAWLNAVQEEICYLIEQLGVTLIKGTNTQLFTALFTKSWALAGSALQSILKGGTGGLDIGTSIASDLRILLNNVAKWTFQASDAALIGPKLQVTATETDGNAITATGNGGGYGVEGTGGSTSGFGVHGVGGASNGSGVLGHGTGTGVGVHGTGGGSGGSGVRGYGDTTGAGCHGVGGNSGPGGWFVAGGGGSPVKGAVNLDPQPAPSSPSNGDIWVETGTNTLKVRINGATKTVTVT